MSLTNRISLYFLAAMAFVLCGFSLTLYVLVRRHLDAQLDERLDAAMKALVAAVEVHPRDVQWEPLERRIIVGDDVHNDDLRWALHDLSGRLRDCSSHANAFADRSNSGAGGWRLLVRRMRAGKFYAEAVDGNESATWIASLAETSLGSVAAVQLPEDRTFESDGLIFTVAVSEAPVIAMSRWLGFVLVSVSLTIWITAAVWGRWLCARALRPITVMAASARSIRREPQPMQMLDVPATRDELEDLGEAFNHLLIDLRESLDQQRRFAGDASHQLRTPLTAMLTSVEVALRQDRALSEYRQVLAVVQRRGGQLQQIIESLLFLARPDGAASLGPPARIELNEWCQTWLDAWIEHPRARDFTFRASPEPAATATHPALLGQVLDNLLDNACKYSDPGTPIIVSIGTSSDHSSISVSDSGCGIAAHQHPFIFEPFHRSTEDRWQGVTGVGLGLAVARRLVSILDATVEVMSEPNKGSCFKIVLHTYKEPITQASQERREFRREYRHPSILVRLKRLLMSRGS